MKGKQKQKNEKKGQTGLKIILYFLFSIVVYYVILFLSVNLGSFVAVDPITSAVSILVTVMIMCTGAIVRAINKNKKE